MKYVPTIKFETKINIDLDNGYKLRIENRGKEMKFYTYMISSPMDVKVGRIKGVNAEELLTLLGVSLYDPYDECKISKWVKKAAEVHKKGGAK